MVCIHGKVCKSLYNWQNLIVNKGAVAPIHFFFTVSLSFLYFTLLQILFFLRSYLFSCKKPCFSPRLLLVIRLVFLQLDLISWSGQSQRLLYKHLRNLLIHLVSHYFPPHPLQSSHAKWVGDSSSSHKINWVKQS